MKLRPSLPQVGRGSFGEVSAVRATHARGSSGPLLALKRVACRDARQQREVLAELSAVQSVRHAGVVRMCGRAGRGLSPSPRCLVAPLASPYSCSVSLFAGHT